MAQNKNNRYVNVYIYCPNSTKTKLIGWLNSVKDTFSKNDVDGEMIIYPVRDSTEWNKNPLIAEISMSTSPVSLLEDVNHLSGLYDKYTHQMNADSAYFVVEILNHAYSNKNGLRFFSPDLIMGSHSVKDLFNPLYKKFNNSDLSDYKIIEIETVESIRKLEDILSKKISKKLPWSPIKKDGKEYVLGYSETEIYFKKLITLREQTNLKYTGQYIERLKGLKTDDMNIILCKDLIGRKVAIDASKIDTSNIVAIVPDSSIPEIPAVRIMFYDKKQLADGFKILDPIYIIVETVSFFGALLGINDFPEMSIYRVMPKLVNDNLPNSIQLEKDDRFDEELWRICAQLKQSSSLDVGRNTSDISEEVDDSDDIDLSKLWKNGHLE